MDAKYLVKYFNELLGIGITYLLMNLLLCHGFTKNIKYIVILKFPKRMLEYYFSKVFGILECNSNNLEKILNIEKQKIHTEETYDSDYVITFNTTIISISNTLNKLLLHSSLHYSYIQTKYNDKEESINNIFGTYVEPLLNDINHPTLIQEWKINIDAASYESKIDPNMYKPSV